MKTITYTCDVCGRPIERADRRVILINGIEKDLDPACLRAATDAFENLETWEPQRAAALAKIEDENKPRPEEPAEPMGEAR